jgi:SEC-C motif-containing protein
MRARYAAYALGNVRFILQTERPNPPRSAKEQAAQRHSLKQFCQNTQFLGLEILDEAMLDGKQATVTFRATLLQGGQDASFTEKSLFERKNGRWVYVSALPEN